MIVASSIKSTTDYLKTLNLELEDKINRIGA